MKYATIAVQAASALTAPEEKRGAAFKETPV